ncbi:MAG: dinitrogenase iron-molybdenum cofactor biosynthesis protein [Candidatus Bathyarchaeum sp.]|nr:MAG: dinitrogenase iron-molybdenum cofactor biosynthesis protein [Candidatus Bathyarchaeum sp.]
MKICVSSTSDNLDANVDARFGRCPYFIVVDSKTMEFNSFENDSDSAAHGAGIQAAQTVANLGAKVVITGNVGPKAFSVLSAAGIKVITGVSGKIRDVANKYNSGELKETTSPNVGGHFGMGQGSGRGR